MISILVGEINGRVIGAGGKGDFTMMFGKLLFFLRRKMGALKFFFASDEVYTARRP